MKWLYSILLMVSTYSLYAYSPNEQKYERSIGVVRKDCERDLFRTDGLRLIGCGGGLVKEVRTFIFHFEGTNILGIDESRDLVIRGLDGALARLNADAILRTWVSGQPFTALNIDFKVSFARSDGEFPSSEYIAYISCRKGVIRYSVFDQSVKRLRTIFQESLEEARGKVNDHLHK